MVLSLQYNIDSPARVNRRTFQIHLFTFC